MPHDGPGSGDRSGSDAGRSGAGRAARSDDAAGTAAQPARAHDAPRPSRPVVLVSRPLGLGDFLTGVPAYRALRAAFPDHEVVLAANAAFRALVPLTGAIDRLLPTTEYAPVAWTGPRPDVAVDLHGRGPQSHDRLAALRPRRLIAFGGPTGGGYAGPVWRQDEHERARWCRLLTESGIPADPDDLALRRPPAGSAWDAWAGATVVHPGAASASRRWPTVRFAGLVAELSARGHRVVVTGGPGESALVDDVAAAGARRAETAALTDLAALVAVARVVVCGDTGVAHLASAYDRPSVLLFGPTPPAEWGPPARPHNRVLWPAPPGYRGDPHGDRVDPVLGAIHVDAVVDAVDEVLACPAARGSHGPTA